jgi:hypothetical protein
MKTLGFFYFIIFTITAVSLQNVYAESPVIRGTIVSDQNEAIGFASIALYHPIDTSLVGGTVAGADGNFILQLPAAEGAWILSLSAVGYQAFTLNLTIDEEKNKDLGVIKLKEDAKMLEGVVVKSMLPTIEMEADKMVVTVEGTAMSEGNTALDVLSKTPGIWIDQDGNIQLNGKQGVMVMIDDRPTYMSARELQTLLQGMPANNIRNIEVITNPSARYDAQGTAGIINLNLVKNYMVGMNGSVYVGHEFNRYHGANGGLQVNYKRGKVSSFFNADYSRRNNYRDVHTDRFFNINGNAAEMSQDGEWRFISHNPSLRAGLDYDINDRHSIGFSVRGNYYDGSDDFSMLSNLITGNNGGQWIDSKNVINREFTRINSNLHYIAKIDSSGRKLTIDVDHANMTMDHHSTFDNIYRNASGNLTDIENIANVNPVNYNIFALRSDYIHPLSKGRKLETGIKASRVVSDNDLNFTRLTEQGWQPISNMSNHFIYTEHILAGYINFNTKITEKISLKAGLRGEQTYADGYSVTLDSSNYRSYFNLFPSIFVQQKVSDFYSLNYNYSRRINRPYYENLNPFIFYIDPYTFAGGNPHLNPAFIHNFEFTQTFQSKYNLTLGYSLTHGNIMEVPFFNREDNTTLFRVSNFDRNQNLSLRAIVPLQLAKWWQVQSVVVAAYNEIFSDFEGAIVKNEVNTLYTQINNTFSLPKGIRFELIGNYMSPQAFGAYETREFIWVDAAVKKSFADNKLELSVNGTDIFRTMKFIGGSNFQGQDLRINQYNGNQSIRFTLRYRFSKGEKFESALRNGGLEEINRVGH